MQRQLFWTLGLLLLVSCNQITGVYVDMLNEEDTIIIKSKTLYERRVTINDSLFIRVGRCEIENGEILFRDWKGERFDSAITSMEIDRPIFRYYGIRLIYNSDLEDGYYKQTDP